MEVFQKSVLHKTSLAVLLSWVLMLLAPAQCQATELAYESTHWHYSPNATKTAIANITFQHPFPIPNLYPNAVKDPPVYLCSGEPVRTCKHIVRDEYNPWNLADLLQSPSTLFELGTEQRFYEAGATDASPQLNRASTACPLGFETGRGFALDVDGMRSFGIVDSANFSLSRTNQFRTCSKHRMGVTPVRFRVSALTGSPWKNAYYIKVWIPPQAAGQPHSVHLTGQFNHRTGSTTVWAHPRDSPRPTPAAYDPPSSLSEGRLENIDDTCVADGSTIFVNCSQQIRMARAPISPRDFDCFLQRHADVWSGGPLTDNATIAQLREETFERDVYHVLVIEHGTISFPSLSDNAYQIVTERNVLLNVAPYALAPGSSRRFFTQAPDVHAQSIVYNVTYPYESSTDNGGLSIPWGFMPKQHFGLLPSAASALRLPAAAFVWSANETQWTPPTKDQQRVYMVDVWTLTDQGTLQAASDFFRSHPSVLDKEPRLYNTVQLKSLFRRLPSAEQSVAGDSTSRLIDGRIRALAPFELDPRLSNSSDVDPLDALRELIDVCHRKNLAVLVETEEDLFPGYVNGLFFAWDMVVLTVDTRVNSSMASQFLPPQQFDFSYMSVAANSTQDLTLVADVVQQVSLLQEAPSQLMLDEAATLVSKLVWRTSLAQPPMQYELQSTMAANSSLSLRSYAFVRVLEYLVKLHDLYLLEAHADGIVHSYMWNNGIASLDASTLSTVLPLPQTVPTCLPVFGFNATGSLNNQCTQETASSWSVELNDSGDMDCSVVAARLESNGSSTSVIVPGFLALPHFISAQYLFHTAPVNVGSGSSSSSSGFSFVTNGDLDSIFLLASSFATPGYINLAPGDGACADKAQNSFPPAIWRAIDTVRDQEAVFYPNRPRNARGLWYVTDNGVKLFGCQQTLQPFEGGGGSNFTIGVGAPCLFESPTSRDEPFYNLQFLSSPDPDAYEWTTFPTLTELEDNTDGHRLPPRNDDLDIHNPYSPLSPKWIALWHRIRLLTGNTFVLLQGFESLYNGWVTQPVDPHSLSSFVTGQLQTLVTARLTHPHFFDRDSTLRDAQTLLWSSVKSPMPVSRENLLVQPLPASAQANWIVLARSDVHGCERLSQSNNTTTTVFPLLCDTNTTDVNGDGIADVYAPACIVNATDYMNIAHAPLEVFHLHVLINHNSNNSLDITIPIPAVSRPVFLVGGEPQCLVHFNDASYTPVDHATFPHIRSFGSVLHMDCRLPPASMLVFKTVYDPQLPDRRNPLSVATQQTSLYRFASIGPDLVRASWWNQQPLYQQTWTQRCSERAQTDWYLIENCAHPTVAASSGLLTGSSASLLAVNDSFGFQTNVNVTVVIEVGSREPATVAAESERILDLTATTPSRRRLLEVDDYDGDEDDEAELICPIHLRSTHAYVRGLNSTARACSERRLGAHFFDLSIQSQDTSRGLFLQLWAPLNLTSSLYVSGVEVEFYRFVRRTVFNETDPNVVGEEECATPGNPKFLQLLYPNRRLEMERDGDFVMLMVLVQQDLFNDVPVSMHEQVRLQYRYIVTVANQTDSHTTTLYRLDPYATSISSMVLCPDPLACRFPIPFNMSRPHSEQDRDDDNGAGSTQKPVQPPMATSVSQGQTDAQPDTFNTSSSKTPLSLLQGAEFESPTDIGQFLPQSNENSEGDGIAWFDSDVPVDSARGVVQTAVLYRPLAAMSDPVRTLMLSMRRLADDVPSQSWRAIQHTVMLDVVSQLSLETDPSAIDTDEAYQDQLRFLQAPDSNVFRLLFKGHLQRSGVTAILLADLFSRQTTRPTSTWHPMSIQSDLHAVRLGHRERRQLSYAWHQICICSGTFCHWQRIRMEEPMGYKPICLAPELNRVPLSDLLSDQVSNDTDLDVDSYGQVSSLSWNYPLYVVKRMGLMPSAVLSALEFVHQAHLLQRRVVVRMQFDHFHRTGPLFRFFSRRTNNDTHGHHDLKTPGGIYFFGGISEDDEDPSNSQLFDLAPSQSLWYSSGGCRELSSDSDADYDLDKCELNPRPNFQHPMVRQYIRDQIKFVIERFGVDGIQVDTTFLLTRDAPPGTAPASRSLIPGSLDFLNELKHFVRAYVDVDFYISGDVHAINTRLAALDLVTNDGFVNETHNAYENRVMGDDDVFYAHTAGAPVGSLLQYQFRDYLPEHHPVPPTPDANHHAYKTDPKRLDYTESSIVTRVARGRMAQRTDVNPFLMAAINFIAVGDPYLYQGQEFLDEHGSDLVIYDTLSIYRDFNQSVTQTLALPGEGFGTGSDNSVDLVISSHTLPSVLNWSPLNIDNIGYPPTFRRLTELQLQVEELNDGGSHRRRLLQSSDADVENATELLASMTRRMNNMLHLQALAGLCNNESLGVCGTYLNVFQNCSALISVRKWHEDLSRHDIEQKPVYILANNQPEPEVETTATFDEVSFKLVPGEITHDLILILATGSHTCPQKITLPSPLSTFTTIRRVDCNMAKGALLIYAASRSETLISFTEVDHLTAPLHNPLRSSNFPVCNIVEPAEESSSSNLTLIIVLSVTIPAAVIVIGIMIYVYYIAPAKAAAGSSAKGTRRPSTSEYEMVPTKSTTAASGSSSRHIPSSSSSSSSSTSTSTSARSRRHNKTKKKGGLTYVNMV
jgi:glycosidase